MTFFERYANVCKARGVKPCSQRAADLIGCTKASISTWKSQKFAPQGSVIQSICTNLNVSADYLLGLSEHMTPNYKAPDIPERASELYAALDDADRAKVEAYMEGMLSGEKYIKRAESSAS